MCVSFYLPFTPLFTATQSNPRLLNKIFHLFRLIMIFFIDFHFFITSFLPCIVIYKGEVFKRDFVSHVTEVNEVYIFFQVLYFDVSFHKICGWMVKFKCFYVKSEKRKNMKYILVI